MSKHWIINDAYFGKIKDLPVMGYAIKHFIDNVVYTHPNWDILLQNLSEIYVLIGSFDAQKYLKDGEKNWKEIMKKDEYDILKKNHNLVISYMLVKEENQYTHYIEIFDTIIRNNNLGRVMIDKYEKLNNYNVSLVPRQIIQSSAKYWGKMLHLYKEDINTGKLCMYTEDIEEYIKDHELNSNHLRWKHLYNLCCDINSDVLPESCRNLEPF